MLYFQLVRLACSDRLARFSVNDEGCQKINRRESNCKSIVNTSTSLKHFANMCQERTLRCGFKKPTTSVNCLFRLIRICPNPKCGHSKTIWLL